MPTSPNPVPPRLPMAARPAGTLRALSPDSHPRPRANQPQRKPPPSGRSAPITTLGAPPADLAERITSPYRSAVTCAELGAGRHSVWSIRPLHSEKTSALILAWSARFYFVTIRNQRCGGRAESAMRQVVGDKRHAATAGTPRSYGRGRRSVWLRTALWYSLQVPRCSHLSPRSRAVRAPSPVPRVLICSARRGLSGWSFRAAMTATVASGSPKQILVWAFAATSSGRSRGCCVASTTARPLDRPSLTIVRMALNPVTRRPWP